MGLARQVEKNVYFCTFTGRVERYLRVVWRILLQRERRLELHRREYFGGAFVAPPLYRKLKRMLASEAPSAFCEFAAQAELYKRNSKKELTYGI